MPTIYERCVPEQDITQYRTKTYTYMYLYPVFLSGWRIQELTAVVVV